MLNPDGVIYGNYRCNLLGYDLNRKWNAPDKLLQPTIYHTKDMIRSMAEQREITLFCDLHGHFRQRNIFMYGCSYGPTEANHLTKNANIQIVPLLVSQMNPIFSYKLSRFQMEKCKESTARIIVFKEFNVAHSYTCESSFFGYYIAIK